MRLFLLSPCGLYCHFALVIYIGWVLLHYHVYYGFLFLAFPGTVNGVVVGDL